MADDAMKDKWAAMIAQADQFKAQVPAWADVVWAYMTAMQRAGFNRVEAFTLTHTWVQGLK